MSIDKDYLKQVWNSVWKDGLSEFQVQKRYYDILNNELKGNDRSYLIEVRSRLNELEENEKPMEITIGKVLGEINEEKRVYEGDGTEWIYEKDENGNIYRRMMGSDTRACRGRLAIGNCMPAIAATTLECPATTHPTFFVFIKPRLVSTPTIFRPCRRRPVTSHF